MGTLRLLSRRQDHVQATHPMNVFFWYSCWWGFSRVWAVLLLWLHPRISQRPLSEDETKMLLGWIPPVIGEFRFISWLYWVGAE